MTGPEAPATTGPAPHPAPPGAPARPRWWHTVQLTALSLLLALGVGALLIAVADPDVRAAAGYFLARPADLLGAVWAAVAGAYSALFQGAVVDVGAGSPGAALRPLTETLTFAAPLIAAGLAVALAFTAGLFNIGAEGQVVVAAAAAGYVGFTADLPAGAHLLAAVAAGLVAGAAWAGIAGLLKARTGAHEVITTIMLNYVALYLLSYLLTREAFRRPGRVDPISPVIPADAQYPLLVGSSRLHAGLLAALAAAAVVWWLLSRSTTGFRFRAIGANPAAARTAGIAVERSTVTVMLAAGALAGLAGTMQILRPETALTSGVAGGVGFDAITVALLGRGTPHGVVLAGLLFGGLRAGGIAMQAQTGTPIDIVLVVQSLIVLFVAAPPIVRRVFRLRDAGGVGGLQVSKGWGT